MKEITFVLFVVLFLSVSCSTTVEKNITSFQREIIAPPFESIGLTSHFYLINNSEEVVVNTLEGSKLTIPSEAFEDLSGNVFSGEVKIEYYQIESPGEIIASGITMQYEEDGKLYQFETAGMFKIDATGEGKKLKLRENKKITVEMASNIDGEYNFYALDEQKGWVYEGNALPLQNSIAKTNTSGITARFNELKNIPKPELYNSSKDFLIDMKVKYVHIPELAKYENLLFRFNTKPDKETLEKLSAIRWIESKLSKSKKEGVYILDLSEFNNKMSIDVSPVITNKNINIAMAAYNQVQNEIADLEKQLKMVETYKQYFRKYEVTSLGFYNWDRIIKDPVMVWMKCDFDIPDKYLNDKKQLRAFIVCGDGRVIRKYQFNNFDKMSYNPNEINKMVVFMPDEKIATFSSQDFRKLGLQPGEESHNYTFRVNEKDLKTISSPSELDLIISSL